MSDFKDSFVANLAKRVAANREWAILPEITSERMLRAAAQVLQDGSAGVISIDGKAGVDTKARVLDMDLSAAMVVSLDDTARLNRYVLKSVESRQHKRMTEKEARGTLRDISLFAIMTIARRSADSMIFGVAYTTAHTACPALQAIETRPGAKLVSSAFLMVFDDHSDMYSDCTVTTALTTEQLAGIVVVSVATATQFGLEPKAVMLSYSTIDSGTGPIIDLVRGAIALVKVAAPKTATDGPLQSDTAVMGSVTAGKMPGSKVMGQTNTFISPDLDAGSITYKVVQRTPGALAIGPVLQGLNVLVNDLSRGVTMNDIINIVVITAVQTQG